MDTERSPAEEEGSVMCPLCGQITRGTVGKRCYYHGDEVGVPMAPLTDDECERILIERRERGQADFLHDHGVVPRGQ